MSEPIKPSRRTLITGAGLALAAGGVVSVAGCSSATTSTGTPTASGSGAGGVTVPKADVPINGGKVLANADYVVTQPAAGEFKAFNKFCTHQGCPVSKVSENVIQCQCHFSEFSAKDGSVLKSPATKPLAEVKVRISGDNLVVG